MSVKLYVGNLPWSFGNKELSELFAPYGEVTEASVISDKYSGRSKGFGFVTFADNAAAEKAMAELNGKEIEGRAIKVNEAKPMEERPRREFRGRY